MGAFWLARCALAAGLAAGLAACGHRAADEGWRAITVSTAPYDLYEPNVAAAPSPDAALVFRGGLVLTSDDPRFGGLSDVEVAADGRLLALTDEGYWLRAVVRFNPDTGAPEGLDGAEMAPLRDEAGRVFASKEAGDAEDFARLPDGRIAVSFEQSQSVRLYDLDGAGPQAPALPGPPLAGTEALDANGGLEALAAFADGRLLIGAERGERTRPAPLWLTPWDQATPAAPIAFYDLPMGYGLVALERAPDGDFIALERFYAPGFGNRIRVMRLAAAGLEATPARVERALLAHLDAPVRLDNFEGVSAAARPEGGVRLVLLSDDNFNDSQRTLLFVFDLADLPAP